VLMDVQMPEMDGTDATRVIRQGGVPGCPPDLPIVALTAHALAEERDRILAAGMDSYLTKPFELEDLKRMLLHIAERSPARTASSE
jgi:CheY-like chemotaxis protein